MPTALDLFSPAARAWFSGAFPVPTEVQEGGWRSVAAGQHTLMSAPTGSGKTLAAFFWCIDRLASEPVPQKAERCAVLYVSPLKALTVDIERNLQAPLRGIGLQAERLGLNQSPINIAIRTGDTPPRDRRQIERHPPDILITTPESLFLLLTSAARQILPSLRWGIVDEIHSMADTKRGAHLALSLERLAAITKTEPQRIGLSATQRPLSETARFLGGTNRPVTIIDAGRVKQMEITVEVPVDDMADLERGGPPPPPKGGGKKSGACPKAGGSYGADPPPLSAPRRRGHGGASGRPSTRGFWDFSASTGRGPSASTPGGSPSAWPRRSMGWRARSGSERIMARSPKSSASLLRMRSRLAGCPAWSPLRAWNSASTWAPSTSSSRSSRRPASPAAFSGSAAPATRSVSRRRARSSPSTAAICSRRRWWSTGCCAGRSRPPASRAIRSTFSPSRSWP